MKDLNGIRRWFFALLLLVTPGLLVTHGTVEAQGTSLFESRGETWVIQGVRVPPVADTFVALQISPYPIRELGFSMKYQTPLTRRVSLDLYVYPVPDSLTGMPPVEAAEVEFQKALDELKRYTASNREGTEVTVDTEGPLDVDIPDGVTRSGWLAEGRFLRSNREDPTFLYVFSWDDLFIKVRASYHPEEEEVLTPHLDAWLREIFQSVRLDTGGDSPRGDG